MNKTEEMAMVEAVKLNKWYVEYMRQQKEYKDFIYADWICDIPSIEPWVNE